MFYQMALDMIFVVIILDGGGKVLAALCATDSYRTLHYCPQQWRYCKADTMLLSHC